jgi:hypothetical protein
LTEQELRQAFSCADELAQALSFLAEMHHRPASVEPAPVAKLLLSAATADQ